VSIGGGLRGRFCSIDIAAGRAGVTERYVGVVRAIGHNPPRTETRTIAVTGAPWARRASAMPPIADQFAGMRSGRH